MYVVENLSALANSIALLKLCNNITVYNESWRKDYGLFKVLSFTWRKRMNMNLLLN